MKEVFIYDLRKQEMLTKQVKLFAFVAKISDESNGKKKYEFTLKDKTGALLGTVWEDNCKEELLNLTDKVVSVDGTMGKYRGEYQLTISNICLVNQTQFDPTDYSPAVDDPQAQYDEFVEYYQELIERPNLLALVDYFYKDAKATKRFAYLQGHREVHHAYIGGYISQLRDVLSSCAHDVTGKFFPPPSFDPEIMYTAACLFNVGKLKAFSLFPYNHVTLEGYMLGHLNMSYSMVYMAINKLKEQNITFTKDEEVKILHCIATSQAYVDDIPLEYVRLKPMTLEAIMLAKNNNKSAKYDGISKYIREDTGSPENDEITRFSKTYKQHFYKG